MKKSIAYLIIFIIGLTLAGCGTPPAPVSASRNTIITIVNNTGYDCYYLFLRPITDEDWGNDLLGREILSKGETFRVRLPQSLNMADSYDIMMVDIEEDVYIKWRVPLANGANIVFTQRDIDR